MCGITGFICKTVALNEKKELLSKSLQQISHRGPDEQGFYLDDDIALGIARLAIRDRYQGGQPMYRNNHWLIFNGELYDVEYWKKDLLNLGYNIITKSDTEIFLLSLIHYGERIIEKMAGMFAFALWDKLKKRLILGRDRFGEKPLYYFYSKQIIAFSSELQGLYHLPHINWSYSLEQINQFLQNSYISHPHTGYNSIYKISPGHLLIWQNNQIETQCYYDPLQDVKNYNFDQIGSHENLLKNLDQSIFACLDSDKPVGAFLSGGIDSSAVVFLMKKYIPNAPIFSICWDEKNYNEESFIDKVVSFLELKHTKVFCNPHFLVESFENLVTHYGELFADESLIPTARLAEVAKQSVDVVLTGDGSDELFHGYERYFYKGNYEQYREVFSAISTQILKQILHPDFYNLINSSNRLFHEEYTKYVRYAHPSRVRSLVDVSTYLPDNILTKVDRATMRVGLEARAPFLHPKVAQFALSCSLNHLIDGPSGKLILKRACKDLLPAEIIQRKKMGFGVPLDSWFRAELNSWMKERLIDGVLSSTGWFIEEGIHQLINSQDNGQNYGRVLFNLLVLEVWLRNQMKLRTSNNLRLTNIA